MDCSKCLEENKRSMEANGYGYGYIGKEYDCQRHTINKNNDFKWTNGLPYERSRRMKHQIEMQNEQFSKEMESSAYTSSLNHDENTWDILNQSLSGAGFKVSNKKNLAINWLVEKWYNKLGLIHF